MLFEPAGTLNTGNVHGEQHGGRTGAALIAGTASVIAELGIIRRPSFVRRADLTAWQARACNRFKGATGARPRPARFRHMSGAVVRRDSMFTRPHCSVGCRPCLYVAPGCPRDDAADVSRRHGRAHAGRPLPTAYAPCRNPTPPSACRRLIGRSATAVSTLDTRFPVDSIVVEKSAHRLSLFQRGNARPHVSGRAWAAAGRRQGPHRRPTDAGRQCSSSRRESPRVAIIVRCGSRTLTPPTVRERTRWASRPAATS